MFVSRAHPSNHSVELPHVAGITLHGYIYAPHIVKGGGEQFVNLYKEVLLIVMKTYL